jgi:Flp pilus assembly pilin Flp
MRRLRKGQSTLEYVIILAAVVAAIVLVAKALGDKLTGGYGKLGDTMQAKVDTVKF